MAGDNGRVAAATKLPRANLSEVVDRAVPARYFVEEIAMGTSRSTFRLKQRSG